ncbi:PspC domain-containing protein [Sphingosinicella sp. LHD-64]|uniref:PspC domain-containing protein n=1 Tax=Sphingosinicella sp. LHD-64 TaxID=3072139 RepID=UPI00280E5E6C|nr:PspC domain-containing protein [Sphingosinicella sp. LHD-64]MDQ8755649.1 PspC domain-containing protein [Sphingosinicella sp. LHD-64]
MRFELDRENGKFLGVCAGIARSTGIDATIVRVGVVLLALFVSFTWTVVGYGALAVLGHIRRRNEEDGSFRFGRREVEPAPERVRSHELRMRAIETYATSANSRLAREIEELR